MPWRRFSRYFFFMMLFLLIIPFFCMAWTEYDQKVLDFCVSRMDGQDLSWELRADEGIVKAKEEQAFLQQINLRYYFVLGQDWVIKGEKAEVDFATNKIFIKGDIRAESIQGFFLETDSLLWNGANRSISTRDKVIIKRSNLEIYGQGMEADLGLEKILIKSDAKTVIY